jgi:hypothetical protein
MTWAIVFHVRRVYFSISQGHLSLFSFFEMGIAPASASVDAHSFLLKK